MNLFRKKILVAVSGGSDSMYLLYKLSNSFLYRPIALHVNYHFREDSNIDQKIVEEFCTRNRIELEILNVDQDVLDKFNNYKNKEAMAREIRYSFFKQQSLKHGTNILYVAHHKDDFLETAILQDKRSKDYLFFGIKKKNFHHDLNIQRPILNIWKEKILKNCVSKNINFATDYTNFDTSYERNKIRMNLSNVSLEEKKKLFNYFRAKNRANEGKRKRIEKNFMKWKIKDYDISFFENIKQEDKNNLIFELLSKSDLDIEINKNKILGIIDFINARNFSKSFELNEKTSLKIIDKKIIIIKK